MPAPKTRELATEDWQVMLSPSSIALRSGAVMAFFTAIVTVAAEVPLIHAITRTMVALVIFTLLGWLAGYFITSLDFEAFQAGPHQAGPVAAPFVLSPSGLVEQDEEDVLSEDVFELAIPADGLAQAPPGEAAPAALPAGGATEVLRPQNTTQGQAADKKPARNVKSRKLVLN